MMNNIKLSLKAHSAAYLWSWLAVIFLLCSTPGQYIPSVSWLEMLSFDKWVHAGIFFILVVLMFIHADDKLYSLSKVILLFILCVAYGGALEVMQAQFFSQRSADVQDFIANSFGCLMALVFRKHVLNWMNG